MANADSETLALVQLVDVDGTVACILNQQEASWQGLCIERVRHGTERRHVKGCQQGSG